MSRDLGILSSWREGEGGVVGLAGRGGAGGPGAGPDLQVVRLVAEGRTNQEVAAQLFISPRTVAHHLYNAFPKLGVASRADIARLDLEDVMAKQ